LSVEGLPLSITQNVNLSVSIYTPELGEVL